MKKGWWIKAFNTSLLITVVALSIYLITLGKEDISTAALEIGYLGIAIFSFLLDVSFQVLGPDIFLVSGVIGQMNIYILTAVVVASSSLASLVAYYLGITHSTWLLRSFMDKKKSEKAIYYFRKYGNWGMAFIALTPIPDFAIIGGIFKMKMRDFMIYVLLMRAIHFIIVAAIMALII